MAEDAGSSLRDFLKKRAADAKEAAPAAKSPALSPSPSASPAPAPDETPKMSPAPDKPALREPGWGRKMAGAGLRQGRRLAGAIVGDIFKGSGQAGAALTDAVRGKRGSSSGSSAGSTGGGSGSPTLSRSGAEPADKNLGTAKNLQEVEKQIVILDKQQKAWGQYLTGEIDSVRTDVSKVAQQSSDALKAVEKLKKDAKSRSFADQVKNAQIRGKNGRFMSAEDAEANPDSVMNNKKSRPPSGGGIGGMIWDTVKGWIPEGVGAGLGAAALAFGGVALTVGAAAAAVHFQDAGISPSKTAEGIKKRNRGNRLAPKDDAPATSDERFGGLDKPKDSTKVIEKAKEDGVVQGEVVIKSNKSISITATLDILLQSKSDVTIKAEKITLDAKKIVFKGQVEGNTPGSQQKPDDDGSKQTSQPATSPTPPETSAETSSPGGSPRRVRIFPQGEKRADHLTGYRPMAVGRNDDSSSPVTRDQPPPAMGGSPGTDGPKGGSVEHNNDTSAPVMTGDGTPNYTPGAVGKGAYGKGANISAERMAKSGVNSTLVESIMGGGTKAFGDPNDPNTRYVVQMQGGIRQQSSGKHGQGKAVDLQIYDRKLGTFVGGDARGDIMKNAFSNPDTYKLYDHYHRQRYEYIKEKYGEDVAKRLSAGTRFGRSIEGGGADEMHASIDEGGSLHDLGKVPGGQILDNRTKRYMDLDDWVKQGKGPWSNFDPNSPDNKLEGKARPASATPDTKAAPAASVATPDAKAAPAAGVGGNPLVAQRAGFAEALKNPATREKMLALMSAEEGEDDSDSRKALAETTMNRAYSKGNTKDLERAMDPRYYQPFQDGSYSRHLQKIRTNPEYRAQVEKDLDAVINQGTNISNLATDNASGRVKAHAMKTSTLAYEGKNKEGFFRKDRDPVNDGAGNVAMTRKWYAETKAALEAAKANPTSAAKENPAPPVQPTGDDAKPKGPDATPVTNSTPADSKELPAINVDSDDKGEGMQTVDELGRPISSNPDKGKAPLEGGVKRDGKGVQTTDDLGNPISSDAALDTSNANVSRGVPTPPNLPTAAESDASGEKVTENVATGRDDTLPKHDTQGSAVNRPETGRPESISSPVHHPESERPRSGSDGYGDQKHDPDNPCGLCAV